MSLLGAYKKKSSYDGYESLQLVDSGADSFSGSSGTLAGSIAASLAPKPAPLREDDRSTMDSSGTVTGVCVCVRQWLTGVKVQGHLLGSPPGLIVSPSPDPTLRCFIVCRAEWDMLALCNKKKPQFCTVFCALTQV